MELVEEYGAPLKFTYLPQISNNIQRAKQWFADAIEKHDYKGNTTIAIVQKARILNMF